MLKVKGTVRPRTLWIAAALINAAIDLDLHLDMVITSANDSAHMTGSKHYTDEAIDFRTHHLGADIRQQLLERVRGRLGAGYQLLLEDEGTPNEHAHVEYDP